jgi:hypothetical protein
MGIVGDVRLGMMTANECRSTVEDMIQRGRLVSVTASKGGCAWEEDAVADITMSQIQRRKGYIHALGNSGLSSQLRWTMQKGGPMYVVRWGLLNWVTNVRELADNVRAIRREKGACWERAVAQGMEKYMLNRGVLALAEWQGSHEEECPVETEECDFWDCVSGVLLKAKSVRKARPDETTEFGKHQVYVKAATGKCWERTGKGLIGVQWVDISRETRNIRNAGRD